MEHCILKCCDMNETTICSIQKQEKLPHDTQQVLQPEQKLLNESEDIL